jgi:DNA invertase Pin-like site-specific DNA recombinase
MPASHKASKWAHIPPPPPGARFRGYLRYSERDRSTTDKHTLEMQRSVIQQYAEHFGWRCAGWDEEPATSGAAESAEQRPAFARHLAAAEAGEFEVSLVHMSDRWARDTEIALHSLKRLRRAGIYWATALPGLSTPK